MKTELSSLSEQSTRFCRKCKRELSRDFFYVSKSTQRPGKYCKECRKLMSRRQYTNDKRACPMFADKTPSLVITQISDRELRIKLILHALEVVRQSMERNKKTGT